MSLTAQLYYWPKDYEEFQLKDKCKFKIFDGQTSEKTLYLTEPLITLFLAIMGRKKRLEFD